MSHDDGMEQQKVARQISSASWAFEMVVQNLHQRLENSGREPPKIPRGKIRSVICRATLGNMSASRASVDSLKGEPKDIKRLEIGQWHA